MPHASFERTARYVSVEWLEPNHLHSIVRLESCADSPWFENDYKHLFKRKHYVGVGAFDANRFLHGILLYTIGETEFLIQRLLVCRRSRLHGIARLLLDWLCFPRGLYKKQQVAAVVRESQLPVLKCLRACNFTAVKPILRNEFKDPPDDGIKMVRPIVYTQNSHST